MTKDQEREVLKKIEKLIASTGSDSYISAAFDGCVELANENIDNDFMTSFKERSEKAYADRLEYEAANTDLTEVLKKANNQIKEEQDYISELGKERDNYCQLLQDKKQRIEELNEELVAAQKEKDELKQEIITLKAKLYDLMTK